MRLDAADQTCPDCGGHLEAWKGQFEETEEIDVVEIQYVLKKHKRHKHALRVAEIDDWKDSFLSGAIQSGSTTGTSA